MTTIQRGSVFLTDDFVQALGNSQPAQISKFQCLRLPAWQDAIESMFITAAELGDDASIVNPNILLPHVIRQYWLNLAAHARKYHASVEQGAVLEDFTEQAFWKCIARLTKQQPNELATSMVVAEFRDVVQNNSNVDGNAFMEILMSIPAGSVATSFAWSMYKPTYLYTATKLPNEQMQTTLQGDLTAVYDNDVNYYDISEAQCIRPEKNVDLANALQFNAILLFYTDNDVEQVAGIMFPNAFVQTGADTWQLPDIIQDTDVTLGYTLNIAFNAAETAEYLASSPSTNLAMQAYNDAYRKLSKAQLELTDLRKAITALQIQQASILRILNNGKFAKMAQQFDEFERKLSTHFQGAISTDKVLDLFLAAKQAQGNLQLTMQMSDLTNAILPAAITVHGQRMGQYQSGDVIAAGTPVVDILRKLLDSRKATPYVQPMATSLLNGVNYIYLQPGVAMQEMVEHIVVKNDAGPLIDNGRVLDIIEGSTKVASTVIPDLNVYRRTVPVYSSVASVPAYGQRLFKAIQSYAYNNGDIKTYEDGTPVDGQILAGSILSTFYAIPLEYVAIIFADASTTTANIVNAIGAGTIDLKSKFVPSNELSTYNAVNNVVAYIVEAQYDMTDEGNGLHLTSAEGAYADIGVYDEARSTREVIDLGDMEIICRVTRIPNWDGILDISNVHPNI